MNRRTTVLILLALPFAASAQTRDLRSLGEALRDPLLKMLTTALN